MSWSRRVISSGFSLLRSLPDSLRDPGRAVECRAVVFGSRGSDPLILREGIGNPFELLCEAIIYAVRAITISARRILSRSRHRRSALQTRSFPAVALFACANYPRSSARRRRVRRTDGHVVSLQGDIRDKKRILHLTGRAVIYLLGHIQGVAS